MKRPVQDRLMEHRRAARNGDTENSWGAHYSNANRGEPVPTVALRATIVTRTTDHVDRKLTEVICIVEEIPALNRDRGWQLMLTIPSRPIREAIRL